MTIEPSHQTIILHLLRGAVPERADEISRLWTQYGHAVDVAPSTKGVTMNADASRIQFDTKTIDLFWLYGFSAWHAIEVYAPALVLATVTGIPLDQALKIDEARGPFEFDYKQLIASAQSLIAAEQTADADFAQLTSDKVSSNVTGPNCQMNWNESLEPKTQVRCSQTCGSHIARHVTNPSLTRLALITAFCATKSCPMNPPSKN